MKIEIGHEMFGWNKEPKPKASEELNGPISSSQDVVAHDGSAWIEVKSQELFGLDSMHWTGQGTVKSAVNVSAARVVGRLQGQAERFRQAPKGLSLLSTPLVPTLFALPLALLLKGEGLQRKVAELLAVSWAPISTLSGTRALLACVHTFALHLALLLQGLRRNVAELLAVSWAPISTLSGTRVLLACVHTFALHLALLLQGLRRQAEELMAVSRDPRNDRRWAPPCVVLFFPDEVDSGVAHELQQLGVHVAVGAGVEYGRVGTGGPDAKRCVRCDV
eukprot:365224-Chlamydomonas_euryale.AAC.20